LTCKIEIPFIPNIFIIIIRHSKLVQENLLESLVLPAVDDDVEAGVEHQQDGRESGHHLTPAQRRNNVKQDCFNTISKWINFISFTVWQIFSCCVLIMYLTIEAREQSPWYPQLQNGKPETAQEYVKVQAQSQFDFLFEIWTI
jgi:hypothetical protein